MIYTKQQNKDVSKTVLLFRQMVKHRNLMLMILPALLTFLIFRYGAMMGISIAFVDLKVKIGQSFFQSVMSSPFVGLKHFKAFFTSMTGLQVLRNTVLISFYKILFGFPMPILLAILLNEIRNNKFKRIVQTVTYLPHFISWVVLAGLLRMMLSPDFGVLVPVFKFLNLPVINFIGDSSYFRGLLVMSDIWVNIGWGSIIYLAALSGIDPELYEAAIIDGAGRMQRIWSITIPCLFPTIVVMLILRTGTFMDAGFDQVFNLYNNSVRSVSEIIDTYVYQKGIIDSKFSFSTAIGLFKSVIGLGMVLMTNFLAKKMGQQGII